MRYKRTTSPMIRATLAAIEAVDWLHNTRNEDAKEARSGSFHSRCGRDEIRGEQTCPSSPYILDGRVAR
jgi:hypothetical protein